MNNIFSDVEFNVSNYMKSSTERREEDAAKIHGASDARVDEAERWSEDAMRVIITPVDDLHELENKWIDFRSMIRKNQRESDWKSLELFGMTNQEHYERLRAELMGFDHSDHEDSDMDDINHQRLPLVEAAPVWDDTAESYYRMKDAINYGPIEIEKAELWAKESNRIIIIPTRTLQELEDLWTAWNGQIKKHRRESDWTSIELFGATNLTHYEYLKSQFLKQDIAISDEEKYGHVVESCTSMSNYCKSLNRTDPLNAIKYVVDYAIGSNSIYEECIVGNLIDDISSDPDLIQNYPTAEFPSGDMPFYTPEEMIDMGVFSVNPEDNMYGVHADTTHFSSNATIENWFEQYRTYCDGFNSEFFNMHEWVNRVTELAYGLVMMESSSFTDPKDILARKQSILELGWNPDVPFTAKARIIAHERVMDIYNQKNSMTRVVDLSGFRIDKSQISICNEDTSQSTLYPIYIVLTEGKTAFSSAIKNITHNIYTHASIAFDGSLSKMYSYGIKGSQKTLGSFIEEDIKVNTPHGSRVGVYAFFVGPVAYEKITGFVRKYEDNADKTGYGYKNLLTYLFNIPNNREWKLICSQFVDRCLKVCGIDVTHKDSSLVSPADIRKAANDEKRIYTLYEGIGEKYDEDRTNSLIKTLLRTATPLKEMSKTFESEKFYLNAISNDIFNPAALLELAEQVNVIKNEKIRNYLIENLFDPLKVRAYCEAKDMPAYIDDNGNLLIKNIKKIDFEAEYAKSHKLLQEYLKAENYEGIKYEIAKLWMMISILEDMLHGKKKTTMSTEDINKARAKIINDFKYYLNRVIENDPKFNFTEYFDNSPFSSSTYKVNRPTMKFMIDMIKKFIKPV